MGGPCSEVGEESSIAHSRKDGARGQVFFLGLGVKSSFLVFSRHNPWNSGSSLLSWCFRATIPVHPAKGTQHSRPLRLGTPPCREGSPAIQHFYVTNLRRWQPIRIFSKEPPAVPDFFNRTARHQLSAVRVLQGTPALAVPDYANVERLHVTRQRAPI